MKKIIIISNIIIFPLLSFSQDINLFYQYKEQIDFISKKYLQQKTNFNIRVFDISNKTVNLFMTSNYGNFDFKKDFLSSNYKPNILINGQQSSICVIAYNPETAPIMYESYIKTFNITPKEVLFYFSAHELGHCFLSQYLLENSLTTVSKQDHETIADIYAILLSLKYNLNIKLFVLKNIQNLPSNDIHYNYFKITTFLDNFDYTQEYNETKLIELIYKIFYSNKQ